MKKGTYWFFLILLFFLLIVVTAFSIWIFFLGKPRIGIDCTKTSGWKWSKDCHYIEEKFFDSSLKDPSNLKLYLVKFSKVRGAGNPVCLPMWYCFRYVNVKTGGYSKFSAWTESPIRAGGTDFPCLNGVGKCNENLVPEGTKTCYFNQPLIGTPDLQYDPFTPRKDGSFIYTNIHRYVGKIEETKPPGPPDKVDTKIIGYLIPSTIGDVPYAWPDVLFNPCEEGGRGCSRCKGCG